MRLIRKTKQLALAAANISGVSSLIGSSRWRQQRLLILCYHGISQDDEHLWSDLYVSPKHLEQRLDILADNGSVVPLNDALQQLSDGTLPARAVTLTFDDGMCDFASQAAPLLGNANATATLYLPTYYCRKPIPVFDPFVSYLLWKARGRSVRLPGLHRTVSIPETTSNSAFQRIHLLLLKYAYTQNLTSVQKHEFSRELALAVGADFDSLIERRILQLMNPAEVRALDHSLIDVQLHTHRHRTPTTLKGLDEELTENAREIADMTGLATPLKHFCYPSGVFSPVLTGWLEAQGIRSATTCEPGYMTRATPLLAIPRYVDSMAVTPHVFRARISGSAALVQIAGREGRRHSRELTDSGMLPVPTN